MEKIKIEAQKGQTEGTSVILAVAENLLVSMTLDETETSMLIEDLIKTLPETNEYRRVMEERFGL